MGGVRADFVASLGRRLADLKDVWQTLLDEPALVGPRNEFQRHIHALAMRSRVLHFDAMADRLKRAEKRIEQVATAGGIDAQDIAEFESLFRDLPELAWAEVGTQDQPLESKKKRSSEPPQPQKQQPIEESSEYDPWEELSIPTWTAAIGLPSVAERTEKNSQVDQVPQSVVDGEKSALSTPFSQRGTSFLDGPVAVLVFGGPSLARALETGLRGASMEVEQTQERKGALELARAFAPDVIVIDGDLPDAVDMSKTLARDPITESTPVVVVGTWSHPDQAAAFLAQGVVRALPKPASPSKLHQAVEEAAVRVEERKEVTSLGVLTVAELAQRLADQVRSGLIDTLRPESLHVSIDLGQGTEVLAAVWGAIARIREMLTIRTDGAVRFSKHGPLGAVPVAPWLDIREDTSDRRQGNRQKIEQDHADLQGRRVLVVDDDPAVTWFLGGLFRSYGCVVKEAGDGIRALDMAYHFDPHIVVTDILMPRLDGFGLCRALKRDVLLRDVPVILLSWKEDLLQRMRELGVGADGYLRKEATSEAILRTVNESLRSRTRIVERLRSQGEVRGRLDGLTARTVLALASESLGDASVTLRDAAHVFEIEIQKGKVHHATRTAVDGSHITGEEVIFSLLHVLTGRFHVAPLRTFSQQRAGGRFDEIVAMQVARGRAALRLFDAEMTKVERIELRLDRLSLESVTENVRSVYEDIARGTPPRQLIENRRIAPSVLEAILADVVARGAILSVYDADGKDLLVDRLVLSSPKESKQSDVSDVSDASDASDAFADFKADSIPPKKLPSTMVSSPKEDIRNGSSSKSEPIEIKGDFVVPSSLVEAVIREVGGGGENEDASPSMLGVTVLKPRSTDVMDGPPLPSLPPDAIVPGAEAMELDQSLVGESPLLDGPSEMSALVDDEIEFGPGEGEDEEGDFEQSEDEEEGVEEDDSEEEIEERQESGGQQEELERVRVSKRSFVILAVGGLVLVGVLVAGYLHFGDWASSLGSSSEVMERSVRGGVEEGLDVEVQLPAGHGLLEVVLGQVDAVVFVDGQKLGPEHRAFLLPGEYGVVVEAAGDRMEKRLNIMEGKKTRWTWEAAWAP